jgi:hypothetical protein
MKLLNNSKNSILLLQKKQGDNWEKMSYLRVKDVVERDAVLVVQVDTVVPAVVDDLQHTYKTIVD